MAIKSSDLNIVETLLNHGADTNILNHEQVSPLYASLGYSAPYDKAIVKCLLDHGANVNTPIYDGDTPMHMACYRANVEAMELLLSYGANIDAVNQDGDSPMQVMLKQNKISNDKKLIAVKYLLSKGATGKIENKEGKTAKDIAQATNQIEIVKCLEVIR